MPQTRITAGEWRGRLVTTPPGLATRPTRSLVREALFNILGARTAGARFIDLYAGAGTVGFEALSRGAASVTFVERHRQTAALIEATAERLQCMDRCAVFVADARVWTKLHAAALVAVDVCFIDAPYRDDGVLGTLGHLGEAPPALVVCEHHRARALPARFGRLEQARTAQYGLTAITLLERQHGAATGPRPDPVDARSRGQPGGSIPGQL